MDDAHNLNALGLFAVEDQVAAERKETEVGGDVGPGGAEAGVVGQEAQLFVDQVDQTIGGRWIVRRDPGPDVDQIQPRSRCE